MDLTLNNSIKNISITLTKPKKRGRPSKEDKRVFGQKHNIEIPEDTPIDKIAEVMQIEADKLSLPIKFIQ